MDAVCFIGEHGNYPWNERGQHLYPRYELTEPIVEVFRVTGKTVPVFSDKHFSYSWSKAKQMYTWSRELNYPLMAGSSIPLTMRSPVVEIPYGAEVDSAVALGYGELDAYGFHTLEALQGMVERRKGGETGIRSVEWIEGDAVWKWRDGPGRSVPLLEAALYRYPARKPRKVRKLKILPFSAHFRNRRTSSPYDKLCLGRPPSARKPKDLGVPNWAVHSLLSQ